VIKRNAGRRATPTTGRKKDWWYRREKNLRSKAAKRRTKVRSERGRLRERIKKSKKKGQEKQKNK